MWLTARGLCPTLAAAYHRRMNLLIRPLVEKLQAYVPGEQPQVSGLVKLNTNESPYPPSPKVLAAVKAATDGRLRLYPNPTAEPLRARLARLHRCQAENIVVGNGSDELLALALRAFVEPRAACPLRQPHRALVQFFAPSYSLYPVLANTHGAVLNAVPLGEDLSLPGAARLRRNRLWDSRAALTFITTPNAPGGRGYATAALADICAASEGVVVLDEAYADFAGENAMELALAHPNVLVARTFSKAYSLCFQRVGYMVGHPELVAALHKVKDSYNVNGLGQVAALATLDDLPYYRANIRKIIATRERLAAALGELNFDVQPSQANFLFVRPPRFAAEAWLAELRQRKVLVRWFDNAETRDRLRITVGTDAEAAGLVKAARAILAS